MRTLSVFVATILFSAAASAADLLPIKHGYYVDSATPCSNASNATIAVYRGSSFGDAHVACKVMSHEKINSTTYKFVSQCRDMQSPGNSFDITENYTVTGPASYNVTNQYGTFNKRFCAKSSMPLPWRNIGVK